MNRAKEESNLDQLDLEAMFDEIFAEVVAEQASATERRSAIDEVMDSLDEEGKASLTAAIEGLGKLFAPKKETDE